MNKGWFYSKWRKQVNAHFVKDGSIICNGTIAQSMIKAKRKMRKCQRCVNLIHADPLIAGVRRNGVTRYRKPLKEMTVWEKYTAKKIYKIGYIDIECTNLSADYGYIISWVFMIRDLKTKKLKIYHASLKRYDIERAAKKQTTKVDRELLEKLMPLLNSVDLIIGHYSNGWRGLDVPYIKARCAWCRVSGYPQHGHVRYGDTYPMSHKNYRVHSYRLDNIGELHGHGHMKTKISPKYWILANWGVKKGLDYILDHNIRDVKLLYRVHKNMEKFVPIPSSYL